jgi:hypothetical protein
LLIVILGLSSGAALFADYWLDLPVISRQVLFCMWLAAGVALLFFGLLIPLRRRIDVRALAAVIEQKYPDLGERLTSSVELADSDGNGHGSPVFIARLMEEAERQSSRLDFRSALPARRATSLSLLAAAVVALIVAPASVWPRQYAELAQRFFRPSSAASAASYTLEVTPGDTFAGRGRTVTLSAHVVPRNAKVILPQRATLVVVDGEGNETRQEMDRDEGGDFTIDYKVPGDVSYRVEAGEAVSDAYRVTAITPVELAAESPCLTVTPPAYARAVREEETFYGLVDLSALQHSTVRLDFHFTRPAEAAYLEWVAPAESDKNGETAPVPNSSSHPLVLSEDRQTASFTMPATAEGKYRVMLEAEQGIRTVLEGGTIRVRPDQPPSVVKFAGKEERTLQASEGVPLEIEAADDIGVAGVELEYRINDGPAVRQQMTLQGGNHPSAIARHFLELSGKVHEEDHVHYRFHVRDNFPAEYRGPHVVVYPVDRWLTLRIARQAGANTEKEILARRDEIDRKLGAIKDALLQEKSGVVKVRQETESQASLPAKQADQVKQLQEDNRNSQNALRDVVRLAEAEPTLQPVADKAREVADREMSESQKALDQAPRQSSPNERTRRFDKADQQLASAVKRLEELKESNDKLAQEQLDRTRLERLAQREKRLAEKAAELAAKNPVLDQAAREQAEKMRRQQDEVAADLERATRQSENLKKALEQARGEQAREMAERARDLAQAQRDLMRAEAETQRQSNAEKSAELTRKQQDLAEQAAKLADQTRQSAPAAQTNPLKPEEARRAAEALKQDDPKEAVKHQDQAAAELERLAQAFEKAVKQSADPREAARQLAQAERALGQRVREEMAKKDAQKPPAERLKPLQDEQKAIRQAAGRLSVPPNPPDANKVKKQIADRADQAAESIRKQDPAQAQARMDETRRLLDRLADLLPSLDQRRQRARQEVASLRGQQEEIARMVKQINPDDPNALSQLAEAARRQAESAEALGKLDVPNHEARQERAAEALNRALADLLDRRSKERSASQNAARRQLEQLEQALRDQRPAEEQAAKTADKPTAPTGAKSAEQSPRQLAQKLSEKQRQLAKAAQEAQQDANSKSAQSKEKMRQEIAQKQGQLNQEASQLPGDREQRLLEQARTAMNKAEQALERNDLARTQRKQTEAADKLEQLSKNLPAKTPQRERPDQQETPSAKPQGLPTREQSEKARQLARQQRQLREEAVQRGREGDRPETPAAQNDLMSELIRQQMEVARQAGELAGNVAQEHGAESAPSQRARLAGQSARETARQMQAGALTRARGAGEKTAEHLRQLAARLARGPRDPRQDYDSFAKTRQLEQRQEEINGRLRALADDPRAQAAQQRARQQSLQEQAGELMRQLTRMARQAKDASESQALERAAEASQRARQSMQQARSRAKQGNEDAAREEQQKAAQSLDRAAREVSRTAGASAGKPSPKPDGQESRPQPGRELEQARQDMARAREQLARGQPGPAQSAMRQAAQALTQAAQRLASGPQQPGQPPQADASLGLGRSPGGLPDLSEFGLDKTPYAGKSWGELPGELRTRIVQDMKARYGEDYARTIKLYFEQLASTGSRGVRPSPPSSAPPAK